MAYEGAAVGSHVPPRSGSVVRAANRATLPVPATASIVRRLVIVPAHGSTASTRLIAVDVDTLQGYEIDGSEGLGFSLGKIVSNIGKSVTKAVSDTKNAVVKAAVDTGHVTGEVVTSNIGKAVIGGALALTGVGIPVAAAIGAATQGVGTLVKPGGNIGQAVKAGAIGGAEGAAASVVGKGITKIAPKLTSLSRTAANKLLPGNPFKSSAPVAPVDMPAPIQPADTPPASSAPAGDPSKRRTAVVGPVRGSGATVGTPVKLAPVPDLTHTTRPSSTTGGAGGGRSLPGVSTGTGIVRRAKSAVATVQKDNSDVLAAISQLVPQPAAAPVITVSGGSSAAPDAPAAAPAALSAGIGGIPPLALAAGVVGVLFLMNRGR